MKNFLYTTGIALAVAIASAGCAHKPYAVTPIPPYPNANIADQNGGGTIQSAPPIQYSTTTSIASSQPVAENPDRPLSDYDMDRNALAANTIHFAFDSAVIRDSQTANLQAAAAALQSDASASILVEGNCDERGTEEYNRSLGERRSEAAREALVGMGIPANRIRTISYGKDKPADTGHAEAAWSKNRRDDFVLLHLKKGV